MAEFTQSIQKTRTVQYNLLCYNIVFLLKRWSMLLELKRIHL